MANGKKSNAGRPPTITDGNGMFKPDVLKILQDAFLEGLSTRQACFLAQISEKYYYEVLKNNQGLSDRFKAMKEDTQIAAIRNITALIKGNTKDLPPIVQKALYKEKIELSKWFLERREANRYAPQKPETGAEGGDTPVGYVYSGELPKLPEGKEEESKKDDDKQ